MFFKYIIRKIRFLSKLSRAQREKDQAAGQADGKDAPKLNKKLLENLNNLKTLFGNSTDLKTHQFRFGPGNRLSGALVYIDGMIDNPTLTNAIMRPIMDWHMKDGESNADLLDILDKEVLCSADVKYANSLDELLSGCLSGDTVLLVDGCLGGLIISTKGWEKRPVQEPQSENVVRGPREGFTENLRTNTSLIRRKIRSEQLHMEEMTVGRRTRTNVCLMYLDGVANPKVLEKVRYRISNLDVDSILESGYIEEYIEDAPFSPFATIGNSEKPDTVAGKILEGRVAILVDGTPFVLTAPMLFAESFQTAEDYYARSFYASITRIIRYIAFLITVFAPSVYIALTAFNHELIPTTLLFSIARASEGTPFPVFVEALIMVFAFEVLREAGIRLPRPVGQAISIVGALIMGDAAVNAGIVGAPMVITIALMAVAGFIAPSQHDAGSMLRLIMMVLASFAGFYGISLGFLAILIHLASLESFGVPYFDNFSGRQDMQDIFIRMPLWTMVKRPKDIPRGDTTRRRFFIPPLRPYAREGDNSHGGES